MQEEWGGAEAEQNLVMLIQVCVLGGGEGDTGMLILECCLLVTEWTPLCYQLGGLHTTVHHLSLLRARFSDPLHTVFLSCAGFCIPGPPLWRVWWPGGRSPLTLIRWNGRYEGRQQ